MTITEYQINKIKEKNKMKSVCNSIQQRLYYNEDLSLKVGELIGYLHSADVSLEEINRVYISGDIELRHKLYPRINRVHVETEQQVYGALTYIKRGLAEMGHNVPDKYLYGIKDSVDYCIENYWAYLDTDLYRMHCTHKSKEGGMG